MDEKDSQTMRTTNSERELTRKISTFFKCILKLLRPCRNRTKKKDKQTIMSIKEIPKDIFQLILQYSFGFKMTRNELLFDISQVIHLRDCIGDSFLSHCVYDKLQKIHVINPYRNFTTYYPTKYLDKNTMTSNALICIGHCLHKSFYERIKSYRMVFLRMARQFSRGQFKHFNRLLTKYLIHIDFNKGELTYLDKLQQNEIKVSIDQSRPISLLHT